MNANDANSKIVYPELSYQITGLCFKAQKNLGRFGRERQYTDEIERLLKESQLKYTRETEIQTDPVRGNKPDFVIEKLIVLDLKAKNFITKDDYIQMQRYLDAANLKLGLIVNFRDSHLKPKRILNSKVSHNSNLNSHH